MRKIVVFGESDVAQSGKDTWPERNEGSEFPTRDLSIRNNISPLLFATCYHTNGWHVSDKSPVVDCFEPLIEPQSDLFMR